MGDEGRNVRTMSGEDEIRNSILHHNYLGKFCIIQLAVISLLTSRFRIENEMLLLLTPKLLSFSIFFSSSSRSI